MKMLLEMIMVSYPYSKPCNSHALVRMGNWASDADDTCCL